MSGFRFRAMNKTGQSPGPSARGFLVCVLAVGIAALCGCQNPNASQKAQARPDAGYYGDGSAIRVAPRTITQGQLIGTYRYAAGFWEWKIGLFADGRYLKVAFTDKLIVEDDSIRHEAFIEGSGKWEMREDGFLVLYPADNKEPELRTIMEVGTQLGLMEPPGRPDLRRVYVQVSQEEDKLAPQF